MKNKTDLFKRKQTLYQNIISVNNNSTLFKKYDYQLINMKFCFAKELSQAAQILTIDKYNLQKRDIINIINNFIVKNDLFGIKKISLLPKEKISFLSKDIMFAIGKKFNDVSRETNLINTDFSILKALDNFIIKTPYLSVKKYFEKIKKRILIKLLSFNYAEQNNLLDSASLCWVDRTLISVIQQEFDVKSFIKLNDKLLKLIPENLSVYWKIINNINYLCFQSNLDDISELRKFKRSLLKIVKNKAAMQIASKNIINEALIKTLADPYVNKDKFYYLFNNIKKLANQDKEDKKFCFDIIDYLIYFNKRSDFFYHRFIRESFISIFFSLISPDDDNTLKEQELCLLFKLLDIKYFFYYNKKELIDKICSLLCYFNKYKSISSFKLHKYLDIVDFIFVINKDFISIDAIERIAFNCSDNKKVYDRFNLFLS